MCQSKRSTRRGLVRLAPSVFGALLLPAVANAQSASLYGAPEFRQPLTLPGTSWCYRELPPQKPIRVNDLITVVVKESSRVVSEGDVQRRKRALIDARLQDWIRLDGLAIKPAPQADGDPRIRGSINSELRNEMSLETRDGMEFRITAHVVDIRPNGNLVIEAHREVENNEEKWRQSLTGIVRPEDVLPNNTVLSEKVADLKVVKQEQGHVRDGYKRGWLLRFVDWIKPI